MKPSLPSGNQPLLRLKDICGFPLNLMYTLELSPSLYPSVQDACQSFGVGLVQFSEDEAMTTCPVAELPLMGSIPFLWVLSEFLVEVQDWSHLSLRDSQVCPLKRLTSVS